MSTGNLVTAQTMIDDMYAKHEMRMDSIPMTQKLFGNQQFMIGNLAEIRTREDRDFEVHLMTRTKRATTQYRTHDHTGSLDDTMKVMPTFQTYRDVTTISLKLLDKSTYDFDRVLSNKVLQCMMNILEDVEDDNQAWLLSIRSQFSKAIRLGEGVSFNEATDTVEIAMSDSNKAWFYYLMKSVMKQNNHKGLYDVYTDNIMAVNAAILADQGSGNSTNTAAQFSGMSFAECNNLVDANYTKGLVIATPAQSLCALDWIPQQNRRGHGDYHSVKGGYGTISLPPEYGIALQDATGVETGLSFALHIYEQRADTSGTNGSKQDDVMEIEVSLDVSRNKSPLNSENGESVAFAFGLTA